MRRRKTTPAVAADAGSLTGEHEQRSGAGASESSKRTGRFETRRRRLGGPGWQKQKAFGEYEK